MRERLTYTQTYAAQGRCTHCNATHSDWLAVQSDGTLACSRCATDDLEEADIDTLPLYLPFTRECTT